MKSVQIEKIFGPFFPVFELNTGIYGVNFRIQSEYYKIRARKNSAFEHFSNSVVSTKPKGKPPYSVRILENTDQKKLRIGTLFKQCGLY